MVFLAKRESARFIAVGVPTVALTSSVYASFDGLAFVSLPAVVSDAYSVDFGSSATGFSLFLIGLNFPLPSTSSSVATSGDGASFQQSPDSDAIGRRVQSIKWSNAANR